VTPVRITWTVNDTTVSTAANRTTMTWPCSRPVARVAIGVTVVDDPLRTAQRTTSTSCLP
jgi:hypothetical protein